MNTFKSNIKFPEVKEKLGLGLGMDLPWGEEIGFISNETGDDITPKMKTFFENYKDEFNYIIMD